MSAEPQWESRQPTPRLKTLSGPAGDPDRGPARVLSAIALASIGAGAIHIAAAATEGADSAQNLAFFGVVAAAQIVWGAVALVRAPRWWLALGAVGNLVVLVTWVVSRTVGLPVGEYAGVVLPVGFPDALVTALEAVIVVGSAGLVIRGGGPSRAPTRSAGVAIAAVLVVGALSAGGVMSQLGSTSSSSEGTGGGQSGPAAPGNGGGSGGGYSGGGSSGGGSSGGY
ncbi:MAG: hypothetical protein ACJ77A_13005 [Actinomycetota bacterium]